jgi:hypothetical protein
MLSRRLRENELGNLDKEQAHACLGLKGVLVNSEGFYF